eukprot:CAMPEP_0116833176 /NCGR_PEP_ID=MMETSP0418-20121206/6293_1 /TAXON_ID=1158023 /ORGANISM="Astrosyne radiata, Strain 13vi08-1A" /LENGTH=270 /DNA_ID=CAMNT_0004462601 /DNA_START=105 /DNA_END=917 /DNA_ORIENTATION=+
MPFTNDKYQTYMLDLNMVFLKKRTVFINGFLNSDNANSVITQLLYLKKEVESGDVRIYINCIGAEMRSGLAVYDVIRWISRFCTVTTINMGLCSGVGALLCGAGSRDYRYAMPNSRFLMQRTGLEGVLTGQTSDITLEVQNIKKWNDKLEEELASITKHTKEEISNDMKRDFYLTANQAVRYGLIDQVLPPSFAKRRAFGGEFGKFEGEPEKFKIGTRPRNDFRKREKKDHHPSDFVPWYVLEKQKFAREAGIDYDGGYDIPEEYEYETE